MKKKRFSNQGFFLVFLLFPALIFLFAGPLSFPALAVDDSVCARVKLEIRQGVTLERQAFDAHMRISNGFSHITLEDVNVEVSFSDEEGTSVYASSDPDNTDALFFIRLDSLEYIDNVTGTGVVEPLATADIHWLIIPAPGASNGIPQGALYYVGASLTYTIGGEEHFTSVSPDYIFVKPMPELTLDYFLPSDVYGDDAFTPEIEPPVPFSLGVRAFNNGSGTAKDMKIDFAQPTIVDNEQGLLIGFVIEGCEVQGQPAVPSLLADLGDIESNESVVARWVMTCSLSGEFVEFTADYSHSDELGGELTSLLEAVQTHFLVRDVLVDVPGRDAIRDFLAKDGDVYRVYESETIDTGVTDQSAAATLTGSGDTATLSTPVTSGFMYVSLADPHTGQKEIKEVIRSDGKRIKPENAWLSKSRNEDHTWEHFFNLFDANSTGSYTVRFGDAAPEANPPVLHFIPDRTVVEEEQLSFIVEATDPDGATPSLDTGPLPAQASFTDQGDGTGIFDWTPALGQAGRYEVTFSASDGDLEDSQRVVLTVQPLGDTDGDDMLDAWEIEHFGTLDRDGTGDFDGDGITDLDEFLNGTDPTAVNQAPAIPVIQAPAEGAEVVALQPVLVIENSTDLDNDPLTYVFELFSDERMTGMVACESEVPEGVDTTSWIVPGELNDNTRYFWRVRATDGAIFSLWAYGSFFVNTENDPPGDLRVSRPGDSVEVDSITPVLEVTNSRDPDEDALTYTFEVYSDDSMATLVASCSDIPAGEGGSTSWVVDTPLNDHTRYYWRAVVTDEHGAAAETPLISFLVDTDNAAPETPGISSPAIGSEVGVQELDLIVINASHLNGHALSYFFELDKVTTFDSAAWQASGEVFEGLDTTAWQVTGLEDNTYYFWRVKASDGSAESPWSQGSFFVNTADDPPPVPILRNPGWRASAADPTPWLALNPLKDPDNDGLSYRFEVYGDASLTNLIVQEETDALQWTPPSALNDSTWYYWRARAVDEHGTGSDWTDADAFFVKDYWVEKPPQIENLGLEEITETAARIVWETDRACDSVLELGTSPGNYVYTEEKPDYVKSHRISLAGLTLGATYYFMARSTNEYGISAQNEEQVFFTEGADIAVNKSVDKATQNVGDTVFFTVTATNTGPSDAAGVQVTDQVPLGLRCQSSEAFQGAYDPGTGLWAIGELAKGTSASLQIAAAVEQSGVIANRAVRTASSPTDVNADNDSDEASVTGNAPPVVGDIPDQSIEEGRNFAAIELDGYVTDVDNTHAELTWIYTGSNELSVSIDAATRVATITAPDPDWYGSETIAFTVTDPGLLSDADAAVFTVINVNDPPVAADDAYGTDEDMALTIPAPGILGNDSDIDSSTLSTVLVSDVSEGTLILNADGSFNYEPDLNFNGTDTFTYKADDGTDLSSEAAVILTVKPVNDAPVANAGGPYVSDEGTSITLDASASSDPDNDELKYRWDLDHNGTWDTEWNVAPYAEYTWGDDHSGQAVVEVSDGELTNTATTDVAVNNVAPIVDAGGDRTTDEGAPISFAGSFTDPGADTHTIEWDFGDGNAASATLTPTQGYGDNGGYTVTLTVTDDDLGRGSDALTVTVENVAPTITNLMSDSPSNGEIGLSAAFADKGWLDSHSGTFEFGDGAQDTGEVVQENDKPDATGTITATHHYSEEGAYTVRLVVEDDDGAESEPRATDVLIDKTPPLVTISEPKNKYYHNTQDITIDFEVEDPIRNGVSSGLVEESVTATLDGEGIGNGQIIDLSELGDGTHTFKAEASDLAGNEVEQVVIFEVGPAPSVVHITPHRWSLSWLNPFGHSGWRESEGRSRDREGVTAYIDLENIEVETILPTLVVPMLEVGEGYGDFVVEEVVAAEDAGHGPRKIRSVTLRYGGADEVNILASSGNTTWDFYDVKQGETITIDAGEGQALERYTVLSYYTCGPPLYSAADIIPESILLNGKAPIIEGSAELITRDPSQLDRPRAIAEEPFIIARERPHYVCLTNLGGPERISLEVGAQTIFEDEPYPIRWHDRFSLEEDGEMQMMGLYAHKKGEVLHVIHHNLQEEARIYLDGALALTIEPEVRVVVLAVQFNGFDAISSLPKEALARGSDWEVTTYERVRLLHTHSRKHLIITGLGNPKKAKLVVGDRVIFDDEPFPIRWENRCFIVDGERQDMSIYTFGRSWRNKHLSIHCRRLTKEAMLFLDGELVLAISPPPDVEVSITGEIALDGDLETFDGSFSGMDEIGLTGRIPYSYDIDKTYQRINTSGSPGLEAGDRFGDFEVKDFTEGYDSYRITGLEFRYDGRRGEKVKIYEDRRGDHIIGSYEVLPGETFSVDVREVEGDEAYLKVGHRHKAIRVAGRRMAEVGDRYLDCTVIDATKRPEGPPHYMDLTLAYIGSAGPILITAYDGQWSAVIGTYELDLEIEPFFTIDGSGLRRGHIGDNLVLEYE